MPHVDRLLKDFEKAQSDRSNWDSTWQTVADLIRPSRQFTTRREKGNRRRKQIYDDTAPQASRQFAFALHGLMTNPAQKWFNLHTRDRSLEGDEEVEIWLQDVRDRMLDVFSTTEFGFNTQAHEVYTDLTDFGTAAMTVLPQASGALRFQARRLSDTYIRGDSEGRIVRIYRTYTMANWEAINRFGESAVAADALKKNHEDETRDYVQAIYLRDSFDPTKADGRNKPIASVHIDKAAEKVVRESGFDDWPYLIARMSKDPEELYGRSPAMEALPETGLVNAMARSEIVATEKAVDPPLSVPANSVEGPIRTAPGSIIWRRQGTAANQIAPIQGPNVNLAENLLELRRASIRTAFFHDIVGPLPENDRMTATEVQQRVQQRMQILSPMLARIQEEMLSPLITRVFGMLMASGNLPPAPEALAGQDLTIDYVGPLALAQRASDLGNFQQLLQIVNAMVQLDETAMDNIDTDAATRRSASLTNTPMRFLRTPGEVRRIRQRRAEQQQAAQQAETTKTMAEAAESGAKAAQTLGQSGVAV